MTDTELRVGNYHRSISWQLTHYLKNLPPAKKEAFLEKMAEQEALNRFMGKPVNEDLMNVALTALAGSK